MELKCSPNTVWLHCYRILGVHYHPFETGVRREKHAGKWAGATGRLRWATSNGTVRRRWELHTSDNLRVNPRAIFDRFKAASSEHVSTEMLPLCPVNVVLLKFKCGIAYMISWLVMQNHTCCTKMKDSKVLQSQALDQWKHLFSSLIKN